MAVFLSILYWAFVGFTCILLFPVACLIWLATVLFDRRLRALHLFTSFWAALFTWFSPHWRVQVEGRENIQPGVPYVMVSNHESLVDIFALFRIFAHFKWVSKSENFRIPFVGWNMRLNRYIEIERGRIKSSARMMEDCRRALRGGNSVLIFPEGTRSEDGRMRPFRRGAFELAHDTRTAILPIVLEGSARALPKKGLVLRGRHRIRIRILPPIAPERFLGSADEIMEQTRAEMEAGIQTLKSESGAAAS